MQKTNISISLDVDLIEKLKTISEKKRLSLSAVIRQIVINYFDEVTEDETIKNLPIL